MAFEGQTTEQRYNVFETLTSACSHFYSKGKPVLEKIVPALEAMYPLTTNDPIFLVHLAAWAANQKNKDLKRTAVYMNALSSGDGTPFVVGGSDLKPNLRLVSYALLPDFNPRELSRICYFKRIRWDRNGTNTVHFPGALKRSIGRYLNSMSDHEVKRHVESGFKESIKSCYRLTQNSPTNNKAAMLKWNQKDGRTFHKEKFKNPFDGLNDEALAELIVRDRVPFTQALSWLERDPSPEVLAALFEVASPNQLIVRVKTFEKAGLLVVPEFADKFYAKIQGGSAVDRLDTLKKDAAEPVKEKLDEVRSKGRKKQFGLLDGAMHLDIDVSVSMSEAISVAKEYAATILEVVGENRFTWGLVGSQGRILETKPTSKEKAMSALFGVSASDGTSRLLDNYRSIQGGPGPVDYYVIITDGKINNGMNLLENLPKPKTFVIIHVNNVVDRNGNPRQLEHFLENHLGITPIYLPVESLRESALVADAIKTAIRGPMDIVDEIMNYPLPIGELT